MKNSEELLRQGMQFMNARRKFIDLLIESFNGNTKEEFEEWKKHHMFRAQILQRTLEEIEWLDI